MPNFVDQLQEKLAGHDVLKTWVINQSLPDIDPSLKIAGSMIGWRNETKRSVILRQDYLLIAPSLPLPPHNINGLNQFMDIAIGLIGINPVAEPQAFYYGNSTGQRSANPNWNNVYLGKAYFEETVDTEEVRISGESQRRSILLREAARPYSWNHKLSIDYKHQLEVLFYPDARPAKVAADLLQESQQEGHQVNTIKLGHLLKSISNSEANQLQKGRNPFTPRQFHIKSS